MSNTKNMTEGKALPLLVAFFMPVFLANLCQQAYSMVDSVIVGKGINDAALAAVGSTGIINFLILGFIFGLTGGCGIHMSQSFGAGDFSKLRRQVYAAGVLCLAVAIVSTIFCLVIVRPLFHLVDTPLDIFEDAISYFRIIIYGITISLFANLGYTVLRAVGNSKTPLWATIISSVINIILDVVFVIWLRMGVEGAAWATVISQLIAALICVNTIRKIDVLRITKDDLKLQGNLMADMMKTGVPVAVMNSITAGGCLILQTIVNRMGSDYVASYSACMKMMSLFEQTGIAVGITMLTYVGQNLGAQKLDRISDGLRKGLILVTIVNVPLMLLEVLCPEWLVGMMISGADPIRYSSEFLPIAGWGLFPLGYLFVYRYSLQGLGNTVLPMFSGVVEVLCRLCFGVTVGVLSYRGIAVSEISAWVGGWLFLMASYYYVMNKTKGHSL